MAAALKFAGYDYKFVLGEGTHSGKHGGAILPDSLRWLVAGLPEVSHRRTVTTFYLIRHGTNDLLPRALAGRLPGVHLNAQGRAEAERIAGRLKAKPIRHIFLQPDGSRARNRRTAGARTEARNRNLRSHQRGRFSGAWHGAEMQALEKDERWRSGILSRRPSASGGETMIHIDSRVVTEMIRLRTNSATRNRASSVTAVPIRAALCHWLGMPLDFIHRLEVGTGSVCTVSLDEHTAIIREAKRTLVAGGSGTALCAPRRLLHIPRPMNNWIADYLRAQKAALDSIPVERVARLIERLNQAVADTVSPFVLVMAAARRIVPTSRRTSAKVLRISIQTFPGALAQRQRALDDCDWKRLRLRRCLRAPASELRAAGRYCAFAQCDVSGNSPNCVKALEWARNNGLHTIALVGAGARMVTSRTMSS